MTIDKAIEILNERLTQGVAVKGDDFLAAIKLGIEALKVIEALRYYPFPDGIVNLPGETR